MPINRPINELKKPKEILALCKQENAPVFLTDDGSDELVIMSREYFNRLWNLIVALEKEQMDEESLANQSFHVSSIEDLMKKLTEAREAFQDGRIYPHEQVIARLKDRMNAKNINI